MMIAEADKRLIAEQSQRAREPGIIASSGGEGMHHGEQVAASLVDSPWIAQSIESGTLERAQLVLTQTHRATQTVDRVRSAGGCEDEAYVPNTSVSAVCGWRVGLPEWTPSRTPRRQRCRYTRHCPPGHGHEVYGSRYRHNYIHVHNSSRDRFG